MPADVMDSLGTAEAVVTVFMRVASRAAACFGAARGRGMVSGSPRRDRARSLTVTAVRSDVPPRDDILADRHDAIYRDDPESRVREVVA